MKINNRTHPALKGIKNKNPDLSIFSGTAPAFILAAFKATEISILKDKVNFAQSIQQIFNPDSDQKGIYLVHQTIIVFTKKNASGISLKYYDCISGEEIIFKGAEDIKTKTFSFIGMLYFKKYAEIETKVLPPKSQGGIRCKYTNSSPFNITFIDSLWFTNLIKSDAFKVGGHFRLQPYADGSKKIIWISDYIKKGYSRKANLTKYYKKD